MDTRIDEQYEKSSVNIEHTLISESSEFNDVEFYTVTEKDREEAHSLISSLYEAAKGKRKVRTAKRNEYTHQSSGIIISSWKMNEWDYKKSRVPTQARGLFTRHVDDQYEIVVRGYDKFFNIGEVTDTKWENIFINTKGPYEITVKENGCIIFISGLPNDQIIVTSKHSMGPRVGEVAHAVKGEEWLDKHLEKVGKNKQELARFLYKRKLTAVAELCDDAFEEHVLPYTSDRRGLYLHGINYNISDLKTWPSKYVQEFAKYWGFIPTAFYVKDSAEEVKKFTDDVRKKKLLDGKPIEGFVVRAKFESTDKDFFFKVKYDDPYLMYREWREITKSLLSKGKPKVTYPLSEQYIEWVEGKIHTNPELFSEYTRNRGIIRVRDLFLEQLDQQSYIQTVLTEHQDAKTLIFPVATIGCGDNHQSLTPDNPDYEKVIWKFLKDFEPLDSNNGVDDKIDHVIELEIHNDAKTNLMITIERLCSLLGVQMPSEDDTNTALKQASNYQPSIRKFVSKKGHQKKSTNPSYFMIALELNVSKYISEFFAIHPNVDSRVYEKLIRNKRIPDEHHVTLIHGANISEDRELWEQYKTMCANELPKVKVFINKLVFNEEVMTLVVNNIEPPHVRSTNRVPHVTVGTIDNSVKPFYANEMLEKALIENNNTSDVHVIELDSKLVCDGIIRPVR
ncbi:11481_t:CDS:2 [Acaulospora colombiana]|uniref:11481_t:CDS:1 n=1 Tax=Acaulospora colombiana TaxID=27376 RepID=A0ACA9KFY5_9GLOM|nr:11481_t:CDS:2 [Acaulospora colombiana]